ncbi:MAG: DUF4124 domain-containing protein [Zoogloeaceae bacterium]|jgi:phosphatidate phosphatase PAH1|nr:DUF4124 domain-containing protein [Zoogloeaceae bacterium]
MKKRLFARLCLIGACVATAPVWAQIYKCVDADDHVTYSNVASASSKNCTKVQMEPDTVIPAPPVRSRGAASNPTPADFPKVSNEEQKARDNDKRAILTQELANEQKNLEQAKKDLAAQQAIRTGDEKNYQKVQERLKPYEEKVEQHERNIQILTRDIANLR